MNELHRVGLSGFLSAVSGPNPKAKLSADIHIHRIGLKAFLRAISGPNPYHVAKLRVGIQTFLSVNRGKIFSCAEIADWLYADDADGGPAFAEDNVRIGIMELRARGVPIVTHQSRGYSMPQGEIR